MRLQLVTTFIMSLLTLNAYAVDVYSTEYNTIESVEILEVSEDALGYEITKKVEKLIPLKIGQSKNICFYEKL